MTRKINPEYLKLSGLITKAICDYHNIPIRLMETGGAIIDMNDVRKSKSFTPEMFIEFEKDKNDFIKKYIQIDDTEHNPPAAQN